MDQREFNQGMKDNVWLNEVKKKWYLWDSLSITVEERIPLWSDGFWKDEGDLIS